MLSSDDYALKRLQLENSNIQVHLAVLSLMLELASRKQAQANPGSSWSTEVDNTAGSEPQLKEDCPNADMSFDQTSEEEALEVDNTAGSEPQLKEDCPDADMSFDQTSEEEALAPSPEA